MANKLVLLIVVILLIGGFYFFYNQPADETGLEKITVMMPFIPQPQWMAYYTAKGMGYYEDEGLDVEIQYSTKGSAGPVEQLVAGQVDFIYSDAETTVIAQSQGINLVALYPLEPINLFYVLSKKNKNMIEPKDLIGKEIGVISTASGSYPNLQAIFYLSDMSIDDVEIVPAGTALVVSFIEGQFDAIAAHFSQKLLIENEMLDLNVIKASDYTNMSSGHIITTREFTENNPETVRKFLSATKKGLEYAVNNPEQAVDIYVGFTPDAEKELSLLFWNSFIEVHSYKQGLPDMELEAHWLEVQDMVYNMGIIDEKKDVFLYYTNEFIS